MRQFIVSVKSLTPYGAGRYHHTPKETRESADDYERRTWREKLHVTPGGKILLPAMGFKRCLEETVGYMGEKIPGRGSEKWTKNFLQGVMCLEDLVLEIGPEKAVEHWVFVPSDGRKGGGKRVWKCFPRVDAWEGSLLFAVIDDLITPDVLERYVRISGQLTGVGVWRPRTGGMWGKFQVLELQETVA
jgi:hypothetical protein